MKLRVLIADDEPLCRERLRHFLRAEPGAEIVGECVTGVEAVNAIREKSPDLVLLDVKMPELDGFGVIEALDGSRSPAIIFVTAHDEFAVRAFEANAVDYLLKPFDQERFRSALQRASDRRENEPANRSHQLLSGMLATLRRDRHCLERVSVKSNGRISILKTAEIDWIAAADNYVELHVGKTVHLLRMPISVLADQLPAQFVRISRSLLVNLVRIKEIRPRSHGDCLVILENGTRLNGTRNYRRNLAALLGRSAS